jgi:hypothetical protein
MLPLSRQRRSLLLPLLLVLRTFLLLLACVQLLL